MLLVFIGLIVTKYVFEWVIKWVLHSHEKCLPSLSVIDQRKTSAAALLIHFFFICNRGADVSIGAEIVYPLWSLCGEEK